MTGRHHRPRPPGNVSVYCTDRGAHARVQLRTLQLVRDGDQVRVKWDTREGPAPETGFHAADSFKTLAFECPVCGRHPELREPRFVEVVRRVAIEQRPPGNTPIELDLWMAEAAVI